MRLDVKAEHVQFGIPTEPGCCPVALALKDKGFTYVRVGSQSARWKFWGRVRWFHLPAELCVFITGIDRFEHMPPESFEIDLSKYTEYQFTAV